MISNDDCWVIYMLLSNVKSLFDHVSIQYAIVKPIQRSQQHFKHTSGGGKRQERKEQEKKVAKLPKLDYFGFLPSSSTSRLPTESAMDNPPAISSAAVQLGSASLLLRSVVCQQPCNR